MTMPTLSVPKQSPNRIGDIRKTATELQIGLLTGCQDRPYAFGLAMALAEKGVQVDIIGGDETDSPEFHTTSNLQFLNFGGLQRKGASLAAKLWRLAKYYPRLLRFTARSQPGILHILWNNKIEWFDRTLLMVYYKLLRKKIALTAHNVNQARRDARDTLFNRLTLRMQYHLTDHIFVHTQKMKQELLEEFGVVDRAVTIIRHPLNNAFPDTSLTPAEAKRRLGLTQNDKAILFFGRITPYKGLEQLIQAFQLLAAREPAFRLIIAGQVKGGAEEYVRQIKQQIAREFRPEQVLQKLQFIPDEETELYLKAADVMVLPYKDIFQSGVLFLGYSYGLPVVATDVGSFREEIVEGETGYLCEPNSPPALAQAIERYFESDLYRDLSQRRQQIRDYAKTHHSWSAVADLTCNAYASISGNRPA